MRSQASGYLLPGTAALLVREKQQRGKSLVGSASTVSGLCPIAGPPEYVTYFCDLGGLEIASERAKIRIFSVSGGG